MKKIYVIFLLLMSSSFLLAQEDEVDEGIVYDDEVYVDYLASIKFHVSGIVVSYPIMNLGNGSLTLSFDDMKGESRRYIYSIVHCNQDWTPSELTEMDYIDGFNEERFPDGEYSFNTLTNYTHYEVTFPNEDIKLTKSGNYLLKIYDDEEDRFLVMTRRFMVVEPNFIVRPESVRPAMVSKARTHHEIDFVVEHKGTQISNPQKEVNVVILQNGRWDNALVGVKPQFIKSQSLVYDLLDKITFPAGKEFRYFDLRSLDYASDNVKELRRNKDGFEVTLDMDKVRGYSAYYNLRDINGSYVIANVDNNNGVNVSFSDNDSQEVRAEKILQLRRQMSENAESNNLQSDYAKVLLSLEMNNEIYNKDVYVFGALTDWKIKDEFKMTFQELTDYQDLLEKDEDDEEEVRVTNAYTAELFLKQGFYNYVYVTVPRDGEKIPDSSELEGDWYETENEYTILVYYRPFGERYDRLMSAYTFNTDQ